MSEYVCVRACAHYIVLYCIVLYYVIICYVMFCCVVLYSEWVGAVVRYLPPSPGVPGSIPGPVES